MKPHPARILPAALAAVLALAACGQDGPAADTLDDGTVPGVGGLLTPRPIRLTGGGTDAPNAAGAAVAEDGRAASDMLMPYFIANYVVGDGMPALPTNSTGWLFQAGQTVTAEQVAALAAQFGVIGEPQQIDDGYQISWRVGPDDGSAPSLWVYQDAQLSWSYSGAWALERPVVGCAVAEPGVVVAPDDATDAATGGGVDGATTPVDPATSEPLPPETIVPDCPEPTPPAGVPTKEQAEQRARELITAAGGDPADYRFETYADEWFASVSAIQRLDGQFDGRRWDFGFGGEGVLQYASGQLAVPTAVGPYPLIDLDAAIARLQDQSGFYGVGRGGVVPMGDVAVDAGVAVEPAVGAPEPGVVDPAMPVDSLPEPEPVTVTLVDVQPDVWWAWDVDGSVWLLPAYRFISTDGGWYTVPAVTDEYLVQADVPVTTEPVTTEPVTTEPVTTEPVTTEPVTTEPVTTEPVTTEPVTTEPVTTEPVEPEPFDASQLDGSIGKSLADFTVDAEALGATVRVVVQDGEQLAVTEDYSPTRVNVAVEGDVVTEIVSVG